jgi:hypothetical protein
MLLKTLYFKLLIKMNTLTTKIYLIIKKTNTNSNKLKLNL